MPRESKTSPRRIAAVDRQRSAVDLRKAGATYLEIAQALGYSNKQGAYNAVQTALFKTLQEPSEEARQMDLARLDSLLMALWSRARAGDLPTIDRVLKILERRARLLGLDVAVGNRLELVGDQGGPIQVEHTMSLTEQLAAYAADIRADPWQDMDQLIDGQSQVVEQDEYDVD